MNRITQKATLLVLAAALGLMGSSAAFAGIVWHDDFESYTDQLDLEGTWPAARTTDALLLNTEQARSGQHSIKSDNVAHRVSKRATGQAAVGPGSFRIWVYDPMLHDPTTSGDRVRMSVEVNQHSSRWAQVALREPQSPTHFWYRDNGGAGVQVSTVPRFQGWSELLFTWGDTSIGSNAGGSIYINGNLVHQGTNLDDLANTIFMGNDWAEATDEHFYFDDATLYDSIETPIFPEPASVSMLALGGLALWRRRRG